MGRRSARKYAFYLLFQLDFTKESLEEAQEIFFSENPVINDEDKQFILEKVSGVLRKINDIDSIIATLAKGWSIERMPKVDLAILRIAVYEIKYCEDIPMGVAVNEAVELAKKYSSDEAPSFINGVLGMIDK